MQKGFFRNTLADGTKKWNVGNTALAAGGAGLATWAILDPKAGDKAGNAASGIGSTLGSATGGLVAGTTGSLFQQFMNPMFLMACGVCSSSVVFGLMMVLMMRR